MENKKMMSLRGEQKNYVVYDPWVFRENVSRQEDVSNFLSSSGSLQSYHVERIIAFDCGCFNTGGAGGFCADCVMEGSSGLICVSCFSHCWMEGCGRPICLRHTYFNYREEEGINLRLCLPCHKRESKKLLIKKVVRFLFLPAN